MHLTLRVQYPKKPKDSSCTALSAQPYVPYYILVCCWDDFFNELKVQHIRTSMAKEDLRTVNGQERTKTVWSDHNRLLHANTLTSDIPIHVPPMQKTLSLVTFPSVQYNLSYTLETTVSDFKLCSGEVHCQNLNYLRFVVQCSVVGQSP